MALKHHCMESAEIYTPSDTTEAYRNKFIYRIIFQNFLQTSLNETGV